MEFNTTTTVPEAAAAEFQTFGSLAHTLQTAALAAIIFAVCASLPKLKYKAQLSRLPTLGGPTSGEHHRKGFLQSARQMYADGYKQFKDSLYLTTDSDGENNVVVPLSLLPELRKLGDDVLSFPKAVDRTLETKYTKLALEIDFIAHTIKSDLTPALARLNPAICHEVDAAIRRFLPPCEDWTEVNITSKLVDIVATVSGFIFVGSELASDPEYLDCGTNYTVRLMDAVNAIKKIRPWLRPFLVPRLPEIVKLREMETRATKHLEPIVCDRVTAEKDDPSWQKPNDMLQWLLNRNSGKDALTVEQLAKAQLSLIFAAIHTTTLTATTILHTLAVTPEYIQPLREEIRNAMHENDGIINSKALQSMTNLDSYMKEVIRVYTPSITAFNRRVLKGITLSNGQYIPPGVIIEVPAAAVYADSTYYPSAAEFDGFRFSKLRKNGGATENARNQFVTSNDANLFFGYGRHACPGRFFAANEIKMILARLLLDYDIAMPEGEDERYKTIDLGKSSMPDPSKVLMFKRVEV
ncbi:ent-kaurene oxidase [Phaeosphaeria sp. MPI-PUGE-AT-0046c]|nr:ent-kaurene oxidase [Phaeosphaeria sp. MPI-PUGE-AT-0046c]